MNPRKNITLIIGITIPILMIVFVAASIYIPAFFAAPPRFNFIYSTNDTYKYAAEYSVSNGKLMKTPRKIGATESYTLGDPSFFTYDAEKNESKAITFADAAKLTLNPNNYSPDGYQVVRGGRHDGLFFNDFSNDDYQTFYLRGHNVSRKIRLNLSGDYYWNFRFIGWITNQLNG